MSDEQDDYDSEDNGCEHCESVEHCWRALNTVKAERDAAIQSRRDALEGLRGKCEARCAALDRLEQWARQNGSNKQTADFYDGQEAGVREALSWIDELLEAKGTGSDG